MYLNGIGPRFLKQTLKAYILRQSTSVQPVNYLWWRIYPNCVSYPNDSVLNRIYEPQ